MVIYSPLRAIAGSERREVPAFKKVYYNSTAISNMKIPVVLMTVLV